MIMKTKESEEIFDRGINYFRAGFYSSALSEFYQVKKIAPDYPNIDYIIEAAIKKNEEVAGQISNFIEENFDKEIQDLSEELTFENSSHLGPKIQTLLRQGKYNEALKALKDNTEEKFEEKDEIISNLINIIEHLKKYIKTIEAPGVARLEKNLNENYEKLNKL